MIPKEKAEQLINYFNPFVGYKYNSAKQCALICVEEIIDHRAKDLLDPDITSDEIESIHIVLNYWQQVKTEIESL